MIPNSVTGPAQSAFAGECLEPYKRGTINVLWLTVREGRRFILKGLPEALRHHPEETARLRKEYSLGLRLNHAGIAGTYGFETNPTVGPVIVMEYVDGTSLHEFLQKNKNVPLKVRADIARQIAGALAYMHSLGISHRDLKSDNIMITRRNEAKIIDIGLGDSEDSVVYKQSLGTAQFGAPEQQAPYVGDSRADVYSFGKILEMLLPENKFGKLRTGCLKNNPYRRPQMQEIVDALDKTLMPKKRGFWWWVGTFYGVMFAIGLIFGIIDEEILQKDVTDRGLPEVENTEMPLKDNVIARDDASLVEIGEEKPGVNTPKGKEADKNEVQKSDGQTVTAAVDNADYEAIYRKYLAEMSTVLARDYTPGMDKEAASTLLASKSIEVANISSRMVHELTAAGCPYDEMTRLSNLLFERWERTADEIEAGRHP